MVPQRAHVIYSEPIREPGRDLTLERLRASSKRLDWQLEVLDECTKIMLVLTGLHIWVRFLWWNFN